MPDISPPPTKRRRLSPPASTPPPPPSVAPLSTTPAHTIPDPSLLRIFSWNINGITPFLQPSITTYFSPTKNRPLGPSSTPPRSPPLSPPPSPSLRSCLRRWAWPEVLCLQEVKIAPHDTKTLTALSRSANADAKNQAPDPGPTYSAHFCLPRDPHNARGFGRKIYGVCTLVRADYLLTQTLDPRPASAHFKQVPWDLEGRVLVLELPLRKTAVVNVYAVNGTSNPYRSPTTGAVVGTRHDRKRVFHTLLANECAGYVAKGWKVVVAGDMNIARGPLDGWPGRRMGDEHVKSRGDFEAKFMHGGLRMVDSFRELHAGERGYTYRPRGREWGSCADRVDLILLSRDEGEAEAEAERGGLVVAGMLDNEVDRGPSDHVPLFVGLRR